jgi:hypothetical protein
MDNVGNTRDVAAQDCNPAGSVLDDLGAEITGIAFPVSVCMALTVALIRLVDSQGDGERPQVLIAEAVYNERVIISFLGIATCLLCRCVAGHCTRT